MKHEAHSMSAFATTSASTPNSVWFVNSGASNHMTSHEDWFRELRKPERPRYVEIGDDTTHPIQHIGNVPFGNDEEQTYLKNVLHVPTIMKNMVSVGQIVEQGMQVRFNNDGCFIEKGDQIVAHGRREGCLFILESSKVKSAMYAKDQKVKTDLKLWHKRIGHINL
jgi:hypothetical protein